MLIRQQTTTFINSFINLFNKYLLSIYYVSRTVVDVKDSAINKTDQVLAHMQLIFLVRGVGETDR